MRLSTPLASASLFAACTLVPAAFAWTAPQTPPPAAPPSAPGEAPRSPELFMAIGMQDVARVKFLLASGVSPRSVNTLQMPAVLVAAGTGNREILQILLDAGADVNALSQFGSALTFAADDCKPEVMRLLLDKGADIKAPRPDRITVLMRAARAGSVPVVEELVAKKADVSAADNHGSTALSYAARTGNTEVARVLLQAGARVDAADVDGWTPLMQAAVNGHSEVSALLLEKGAKPEMKDRRGRTALLLTVSYGDHPQTVKALLDGGASTAARDALGRTPLALAVRHGYSGSAKVLQSRGAKALAAAPAVQRTPRQAVEAALPRVEHAMRVFVKRTGCVSCHHEGVARAATGFALANGYRTDSALAKTQEKRIVDTIEQIRPLLQKAVANPAETGNVPIVDVGDLAPIYGSLLLGLAEHRYPATPALGEVTMVLARTQTPAGDWRFGLQRVPMQSSFFTSTATAVRALQLYAPKQYEAEVKERVQRAKEWLLKTPATDTEDRVFRLLGLKWAGATEEERAQAVADLRASQRPDGGWAQKPTLQSDAYATGTALFALSQAGGVSAKDPAYDRGVKYLLRTQDDDGTWYVYKRAIAGNNYFDSEFPHGQSQYISHIATSWAAMALIPAAGSAPASTARR